MLVKGLDSAITYLVKTEAGIKTYIDVTLTAYDIPEKKLWQALKGLRYKSGSQQVEQVVTPEHFKDYDSDSSSDDKEAKAAKPHKK